MQGQHHLGRATFLPFFFHCRSLLNGRYFCKVVFLHSITFANRLFPKHHCANMFNSASVTHCAKVTLREKVSHCAKVTLPEKVSHCAKVTLRERVSHCAKMTLREKVSHCAKVTLSEKVSHCAKVTLREKVSHCAKVTLRGKVTTTQIYRDNLTCFPKCYLNFYTSFFSIRQNSKSAKLKKIH